MQYVVYSLYSTIKDKYNFGYTAQSKSKGFTEVVDDWELAYKEDYATKEDAMAREKNQILEKPNSYIKLITTINSVGSEHPD